jgi:DNA-binding FadR family transcriptional regulator
MNFDPDKTVTANAVKALQDYIIAHDLKPGDSLPTEAEFCELFGVSRGIIREALQYFRTLGIIESRPRKGIIIKKFLPEDPFGPYLPFCRHSDDLAAISEMRVIIELGVAYLLIKNVKIEDLSELTLIAEAMGEAVDLSDICRLDLKFHSKLMAIAGNRFLNCLEPFIIDYFEAISNPNENYYLDPPKYRKDEKEKHLAVIDALKNSDEELLRKLFKEHYFVL